MKLSREAILAMEPGRELDKLVSVHVMGWEIRKIYRQDQSYDEFYFRNGERYENVYYPSEWQPSKYIDAAWEVEEKMDIDELFWRYVHHVKKILLQQREDGVNEFHLMHAPADVRCKAALLATLEVRVNER